VAFSEVLIVGSDPGRGHLIMLAVMLLASVSIKSRGNTLGLK
jgi:hypothetical protein